MTNKQLAKHIEYATMRDAPRKAMANGVHPNAVKALEQYQALEQWLLDNPDWQQPHADFVDCLALRSNYHARTKPF